MPSYSTPSTNLSTGLSTKPTRLVPDYLAKSQKYVPLSVFFTGIPEEEAEADSLFGFKMPDRQKKVPPKEKKAKGGDTKSEKDQKSKDDEKEKSDEKGAQKGAQGPERSQTSKPRPAASVPAQGAQAPQQGAKQESKMDRPHKCKICGKPADKRIIWADGRAYIPVCSEHVEAGKKLLKKKNGKFAEIVAVKTMSEGLADLLDAAIRNWHAEGMTTTANIATVAVPIGAGDGREFLDCPEDDEECQKRKRKRRRRRSLSKKLHVLLRR